MLWVMYFNEKAGANRLFTEVVPDDVCLDPVHEFYAEVLRDGEINTTIHPSEAVRGREQAIIFFQFLESAMNHLNDGIILEVQAKCIAYALRRIVEEQLLKSKQVIYGVLLRHRSRLAVGDV